MGTTAFSDNSFLLDVYVKNPNLNYGTLDPFANCQSSLTFHATGGSTTQAYAEKKGYKFAATDSECDHAETYTVVTQEPTCTAKGKQDVYCSKCLKYLRTEDIAATGHDLQVIQTDDQSEKTAIFLNTCAVPSATMRARTPFVPPMCGTRTATMCGRTAAIRTRC